jgi:hypothetical protein
LPSDPPVFIHGGSPAIAAMLVLNSERLKCLTRVVTLTAETADPLRWKSPLGEGRSHQTNLCQT